MRKINLFELFVKIGVKDEATKNVEGISSKLGKGLKTAAKIGTVAVSAAATGIVALTKQAVDSYAEYEQLIGGAELMFGEAFGTVQKNAQEAYKNVQMSQNEYLQQVNGFATGLKTALGGNEQAAAELADRIVTAEADIIAATGNTAENVQNALNGIMRSNFTMLDNLQIGITPTKEGFQEVIDKVNEWNTANGNATKYQMGNLADMQSALVDYIDMVGYAGYANSEASGTIQGSLASAKAAWSNLVTGVADDNANLEVLIDNFVQSSGTFVEQILPKIETSLEGVSTLIDTIFPIIVQKIPEIVTKNLPKITKSAVNIIETLVKGLLDNVDDLIPSVIEIIKTIVDKIVNLLPKITKSALDLIITLAEGLVKYLPELTTSIIDIILKIITVLTDQSNLSKLLKAALAIIVELANGLIKNINSIIDAAMTLLDGIIDFFLRPENLAMLVQTAVELVLAIGTGLIKAIPQLLVSVGSLIASIFANFATADWGSIGSDLVAGLKKGINNAWANLKAWFSGLFGDLIGIAKKILGIASPSKVFKRLGEWTAEGYGIGFDAAFGDVEDDVEKSLNFANIKPRITNSFDLESGYIGTFSGGVGLGYGNSYGSRDINITQNIYSQTKSAAQLMQEARWQAKMGVLASV